MSGDEKSNEGAARLIADLAVRTKQAFTEGRRELSFCEYLDSVREDPRVHARSAAQYAVDCFAWLGSEERITPRGPVRRYRLFDNVPEDSSEFPVEGLEEVQEEICRILTEFAAQGRVDRMILLHGPNGSAKSSVIAAVARAMEDYSWTDEGALYRYSWVFPVDKVARRRLGFAEEGAKAQSSSSYAYLADEDTAATVPGELNESPLLLLAPEDRNTFLKEALREADISKESLRLSRPVLEAQLCPRSRRIFTALLRAYQGDLEQVWRHVRVERFYLSRRYRQGVATVEPQLHVDAGVRQLTYDQSLAALPPTLRNVTIEEVFGDLVDGNRGVVEFNDLLKRPVDAFKYLLATCEKGTLLVPGQILWLDQILVGSSNEGHLAQFKQTPDFASFKGRLELVRVPYIRDYEIERRIYERQVTDQVRDRHVAPHTTQLAALWAVLTRMKKPDTARYDERVREVVGKLGPLEKADLYAHGRIPEWATTEQGADLRSILQELYEESESDTIYEGLFGASPREMKSILFRAAGRKDFECLSPLALISELSDFIKEERSLYAFLQIEAAGDYHNYERFIEMLRARYRELIDVEIRRALGLIEETEFVSLLERYITHVSHAVRKERLRHPLTGDMVEPDQKLMRELEELAGIDEERAETFREEAVQRIGAFRVEHPEGALDLEDLFAAELTQIRKRYHERHLRKAMRTVEAALDVLGDGGGHHDPSFRAEVEEFIERYREAGAHSEASLNEALTEFLRAQRADG